MDIIFASFLSFLCGMIFLRFIDLIYKINKIYKNNRVEQLPI